MCFHIYDSPEPLGDMCECSCDHMCEHYCERDSCREISRLCGFVVEYSTNGYYWYLYHVRSGYYASTTVVVFMFDKNANKFLSEPSKKIFLNSS